MSKSSALLLLALLAPLMTSADEASDRADVMATVQQLFDAMAARDRPAAAEVLLPEGRLVIVAETGEGITTRTWDHADFLAGLTGEGPVHLERFWDPEVTIEGAIASFRADYDFHRDGVYSHCGVDLFHLVRSGDRWQIAGGVFTRNTGVCADNPLPPL